MAIKKGAQENKMSNPFVFDEDSAEEESMSKDCTIQVPESSSEDSESSSESSKSAGSDEYNFDPNVSTTSIKRMKKRKDLFFLLYHLLLFRLPFKSQLLPAN
ncbi:uncharacterized protein LOC113469709 [Diaphorina citri]|uniref:Uncharacterized protein LOC113469709 n=1 Tax=Diaphorina citri TaxID=121845 RepID=A0A3Q0J4M5_DIACI|nr:uncharacterized protein LOC113469709 [Diaphorina citri]